MRKMFIKIVIFTVVLFLVSIPIMAEDVVDPNIPESWYSTPKTASEWGIDEFNQPPYLDELVANGKLPPVEERLPEDPPVIEPYQSIGRYGGTLNIWSTNLNAYSEQQRYFLPRPALSRAVPDGSCSVAYLAKSWSHSKDYSKWTINLRKGVKWSDGDNFDADDYMYWWEHVANKRDIYSILPNEEKPVSLIDVIKENDYSLTYVFDKPHPRFADSNLHLNIAMLHRMAEPAHFMKQFNPDFVEKEKIEKLAKKVGLDSWFEYYERVYKDSVSHPDWEDVRPDLAPYIAVKRTETYIIFERNPYYPFVDTAGNQLPYIDRIKVNLATSADMAAMKASTGDADFAARYTKLIDLPLYKRNASKEDYNVLLYSKPFGNELTIQPNLSHENNKLRKIFQNIKLRKAISYAINRDDINNKVFYGVATPMQTTVPPTNKFYKEKYANAFLEFNPDKAEELLDEMGLVDSNGDGYRERPDGEPFNPVLLTTDTGGTAQKILELLIGDLKDIGLNIDLKNVSRELFIQRKKGNQFDISAWTVDCAVDLFFGGTDTAHISKSFAPLSGSFENGWPAFGSWYGSGGRTGMEPPEEYKELIEWANILAASPDDASRIEAGKKLVKAQAENIWTIGTVSLVPQPIIVKNRLKNVPKYGIWDASLPYMSIYNTEQFYLDN